MTTWLRHTTMSQQPVSTTCNDNPTTTCDNHTTMTRDNKPMTRHDKETDTSKWWCSNDTGQCHDNNNEDMEQQHNKDNNNNMEWWHDQVTQQWHTMTASVRRSSWLDRKFHWNWTGHNRKRPDHQLWLPWFRKFSVAGFKVWQKLGRPMKTGCNRSFTYIRNTPRTQKICTINFLGYKIVYITRLWLWVAIIIHYQTEWTV